MKRVFLILFLIFSAISVHAQNCGNFDFRFLGMFINETEKEFQNEIENKAICYSKLKIKKNNNHVYKCDAKKYNWKNSCVTKFNFYFENDKIKKIELIGKIDKKYNYIDILDELTEDFSIDNQKIDSHKLYVNYSHPNGEKVIFETDGSQQYKIIAIR